MLLLVHKLSLYTEVRKSLKEEASPFRSVGGSFIKQGNFLTWLVFVGKYISPGYVLVIAPTVGMTDKVYVPKTGEGGEEALIAWVQLEGQFAVKSSQWHPTLHPS